MSQNPVIKYTQFIKDNFIETCIKNEHPVSVFLKNGVRLDGSINRYDGEAILLKKDDVTQLVMFAAIASVMPK